MRATGALGLAAGGASPGPGCHSQPLRCPPHIPRGGAQGPACGRLTARSPQVRGGAQPRGAQAERAAVSAGPEALLRGAVGAGLRRPVRLRVRRRRRPAALVTTAARDCPRRCAGAAACVETEGLGGGRSRRRRGALWGMPASFLQHGGWSERVSEACPAVLDSTRATPRGPRECRPPRPLPSIPASPRGAPRTSRPSRGDRFPLQGPPAGLGTRTDLRHPEQELAGAGASACASWGPGRLRHGPRGVGGASWLFRPTPRIVHNG